MSQLPAVFLLKNIQVIYKAEFSPPIVEIALPQVQGPFIKNLCKEFDIKFKDLLFNNQAISSSLIIFRHNYKQTYCDIMVGVDELQIINVNPPTEDDAWMITLKVMEALNDAIVLKFKRQSLFLNIQCESENVKYSEFIDDINCFNGDEDGGIIISKSASFTLKTPWHGSIMNISFERSAIITDGLFMQIQLIFDESLETYKDIFKNTISLFKKEIEPLFNVKMLYFGRE
jgi:hypothetical protein